MIEYLKGKIIELNPTYVVLDIHNIGYIIHISLNSYSQISQNEDIKLFIHEIIREDTHQLFGFANTNERDIFRSLISVSGIGANTARMMLSSLSPDEIRQAILNGNVAVLKNIKGIGIKSAQRIIVDLKDKIGKSTEEDKIFIEIDNTKREEALSALVMLGFSKKSIEKVLDKILQQGEISIEEIIKQALKLL